MLEKESQKSTKKAEMEKQKVKKYLDKNDMESAKMVAGEAIRF